MSSPAPAGAAPSRASRCWTLLGTEGAVDVEVTALDTATLGSVLPHLEQALGVPIPGLWENSVRLPDELSLMAPALAHGSLLGVDRPVPGAWRGRRGSALELHVVGGPDAGRTVPLGQGRHVLGRGSEATVPLEDPDVSRQHVAVQVGSGRITVADLGSTNGSRLDDKDLDAEPRPWAVGAVLRLGASAVTIAGPVHDGASTTAGTGGRVQLQPAPHPTPPVAEVEVTFPRPPVPPPPRRLAWVAVALPAVGGVLMAWLLDAPTFLFFALLSPVVALGTWLSERWTGRRSGRQEAATHAVEVLEAQDRLDEAVRAAVRAAEAAHPDLATLTTVARRRARLLWSRSGGDDDGLAVRLGVGRAPIGVTRVDGDGTRAGQTAEHMPLVVDLRRDGGLAVVGPRERTEGVIASLVAQLTARHPPGSVDLMLLVDAATAPRWAWARWLPHLAPGAVHVRPSGAAGSSPNDGLVAALNELVARRRVQSGMASAPGRPPTPRSWTVVVVDRALDPRLAATLRDARDVGLLTVTSSPSVETVPATADASLRLIGETGDSGLLRRRGAADVPIASVDRLSPVTAARFARDLAGLAVGDTANALPRSVRLVDLPTTGLCLGETGRTVGAWSPARDQLRMVLGRGADGPVEIDLCHAGPHALVAGTTGSGKSELLQTAITSLALHHPPDRCSFLLVDYKGGAAFAEAAALPHTVGVVTDLDGQTTARALRSLTAELARRESILAAHQVTDLSGLPGDVELARLVIVVDEFATLAEELPTFVPGLVAIAQRGRSLGVHLVLATQRPGGVVSPEIRANCSLRICLRTTDEADSRDVLGTPAAAQLPVGLPGRAYIRIGSAPPALLQIARVATSLPRTADAGPEVRRWTWPAHVRPMPESPDGESDLALLARVIERHARSTGARPPHRPWRPPLPDHIAVEDLPEGPPGHDQSRTRLRIGLMDLPDRQAQQALALDLADGGTWLAVGGPRSGRSTLLRTVLREAASQLGPDDLNVHVIESGGGSLADEATALPHTGTVVSGDDRLRIHRLLERLGQEVAARRSGTSREPAPRLLLLVDGLEELTTVIEEADPGRGTAALTRLLRDGGAAGLTCVVTADRAVPGGRLTGLARSRLVLPLADRADYAVAGVPPRAVPGHRPPGRALIGDDAVECQLAVPRPWAAVVPPQGGGRGNPLRIPALAADPQRRPSSGSAAGNPLRVVVGPGGDEGHDLAVDLSRTGGLLVAGPPGSGRSSVLDAITGDLLECGVPVLRLGHRPRADARRESALRWVPASDEAAVRDWIAELAGRPGVVVADDVGVPAELGALSAIAASGATSALALLAAGQAAQLAAYYQGPVAALRRARVGLLLGPGPGDADQLGIRLPRTPVPQRPGSGWLVTGGTVERVQVARRLPTTPRPA